MTTQASVAKSETQEQLEISERLYRISEQINIAHTEQDIVNAITPYLNYPGVIEVGLGIFDSEDYATATHVDTIAAWVPEGYPDPRGRRIPLVGVPILATLKRHTVSYNDDLWNNPYADPTSLATIKAIGIRAFSFAPLTLSEQWLGIFGIYSKEPHVHSPHEVRLLGAIGTQIAVTVERMRLQRQTERRARALETVAQVSAAITSELNVDRLLASVVALTKERFDLYHAQIYLLGSNTPDHPMLVLTAGAGEPGRQMRAAGFNIPLSREQSLVARAARTRQGVTVNDVRQAPDFLPNTLLPDTRAELAVPMLVGGELIGVLDVQSAEVGRFKEEDIQIQTTLAAQIAIAVKNARQYEAQLRVAAKLREVDRLKSEFLASMSHELRTPLNSIIGFSEIMADGLDGELPEEAQNDVAAIHESGLHLLELINDILDLAKIQAGDMELDVTTVSLVTVGEEVERTTRGLLKGKTVHLNFDINPDLPVVNGDTKRLGQILKNLVSNAIKFTHAGQITVAAEPSSDGKFVRVNVRDTGIGIAKDHLEMVFEQFRQVHSSSTREIGGNGLGLPITRELVHMHGGAIWVESEIGVGSTFSFTIPVGAVVRSD